MRKILLFILLAGTALWDSGQCAFGAPAARVNDRTALRGTINSGSSNVIINGRSAARLNDSVTYTFPPGTGIIKGGSTTVFINGRPAARVGDGVTGMGGDSITTGSSDVLVGN